MVTYNYTLSHGTSATTNLNINVLAPTNLSLRSQFSESTEPYQVSGVWQLACAPTNVECSQFTLDYTLPPNYNPADALFQWVQVVNSATLQRSFLTAPTTLQNCETDTNALDNNYPYPHGVGCVATDLPGYPDMGTGDYNI